METLKHYLTVSRATLWTWPLAMSLVAIGLVAALKRIRTEDLPDRLTAFLYAGDASGASQLVGSLLSGVVALFALVLSVTMVVLVLAAGQLGSRLVHSFIEDRATRATIGAYLAAMLYLIALSNELGGVDTAALPHLAVTVGVLLAAACAALMVVYVNRLARAIVFDNTARRVLREIRDASRRLQLHRASRTPDHASAADPRRAAEALAAPPRGTAVARRVDGYVQSIDYASLMKAAERADAVFHLHVRAGHWINADTPCATVAPASAADRLGRVLKRAIIVGAERTPTQDLEFGLQRLVEISLRALSPGINDLFTALAAIDNLGAAVARIFSRPLLPPVLLGPDGHVRLIRDVSTSEGIVRAAFDDVRRAGARIPAVAIRMLDALARLDSALFDEAQRAALLAEIDATLGSAHTAEMIPEDAAEVLARHRRARDRIEGAPLRARPEAVRRRA